VLLENSAHSLGGILVSKHNASKLPCFISHVARVSPYHVGAHDYLPRSDEHLDAMKEGSLYASWLQLLARSHGRVALAG